VHARQLSALTVVAAASVAAKAVAVGRDLAIAYRFGAGDVVDAFLLAYLVPYTLVALIGGALHGAFLPVFVRERDTNGADAAQRLLGATTARVLLGLGVVVLLVGLGARPLVSLLGGGFSAEKLALTRSLALLLLPVSVLGTLALLWTSALNAGRVFALPSLTPALPPLFVVAAALSFGRTWGITALAVGLVIGHAAEALVLAGAVRRRGLPLAPRWSASGSALGDVFSQLLPLLSAAALMSMTTFVAQGMAARVGSGSVAALGYGGKLTSLLVGVFALALGTAVFPHFSELQAAGRTTELRATLRTWSRAILWGSLIPVSVLVLGSEQIVRALFERGAFSPADTAAVAPVQALYLLQIPFYVTGILGIRLLTSAGRGRLVMAIAAANLVVNVVANLFFMRWWGVAGIALSTTLVYALSCLMIYAAVNRYLGADA
jgi:putative peptidoglycan lipid II flippase